MPSITDWLMVAITAVYVVATIFISRSNHQSAAATREQVAESMRQFNEANRAFVTVTFESIRGGLCVLHFQNHGKRVANNVRVTLSQEFMDAFTTEDDKYHMMRLCQSSFILGIGQSWYCSLFSHIEIPRFAHIPLHIELCYEDSSDKYNESIDYDLSQYSWGLIYNSELSDISNYIKVLSDTAKKAEKTATKQLEQLKILATEIKANKPEENTDA
jgi:hypothetical protein